MKLYIHFNHDWSLSVGSIKTESTEVPKYTGVKMMMNAFSFYRLAVENQEVWGNSAIKLDFRIKCAVINGYCGIIFIFGGGGSTFVGSQNLPGSWGHNFIAGSILLINIKQMLVNVYILVGMQFCAQGLPTKAINIGPPKTMMISQ